MPRAALTFWIGCVLLLGGCETTVDPSIGSDQAFSLYGVLQPEADTQWVRVYPIEDALTPTPPTPLDATLTSTALETGQSQTWRDSVVQESSGDYAHVYWFPFQVEHGRTYRLAATGPHGTAQVDVDVPAPADLVVQPPQINYTGVILPVLVNNTVPHLLGVEVEYFFQYDFAASAGSEPPLLRVTESYDGTQRRTDAGWIIPITLTVDFLTLRQRLDNADLWNPRHGLVMVNMTLRLTVANEEWDPPNGTFDADVLVQPGTMSNVENGFGFVGSGYRLDNTWTPEIETLVAAGWTDPSTL
jgi:hypothetical protein